MARFNFSSAGKMASSLGAVAREKSSFEHTSFDHITTLAFAGLLIVCSIAVGCSSEKPKTQSTNNQSPIQMTPPAAITPVPAMPALQADAKPTHKKVVRKAPATTTYADTTFGVTFKYPKKYALKTGEGADDLISAGSVPMDFVQPGGVAVAAVAVPEGAYPKSDLASAFFDVSVNKSLTEAQCGEFPAVQAIPATPAEPAGQPTVPTTVQPAAEPVARPSKLMIGDMELQSNETTVSNGTRKEASKYYHVFENGACYEFALKVATTGDVDEGGKAVHRDEIFKRLEGILATVKINPVKAAEVAATAPTPTGAVATPAQ